MYDNKWHARHAELTTTSAVHAVEHLRTLFAPDSVLDVGCGDGRWLEAFGKVGVTTLCGLDGSWNNIERLRFDRASYSVQELGESFDLDRRFDLVTSLEVAEHVEARYAERFVANLVRHSDVVVFSAAIPYQGGFRHVNERWQSWWAARFDAHGYRCFDPLRARLWPLDDVHFWYKQNLLVYVNERNERRLAQIRAGLAQPATVSLPLDTVHPEKYLAVASYDHISFKPLLRRLPGRTASKLHQLWSERVLRRFD